MPKDANGLNVSLLDASAMASRENGGRSHPYSSVSAHAYGVQDEAICNLIEAGDHIVGVVAEARAGVGGEEVATGWVMSSMIIPGATVPPSTAQLIGTTVQGYLAVVLEHTLVGHETTPTQAMSAIRTVHGAVVVRELEPSTGVDDEIAANLSITNVQLGVQGLPPHGIDLMTEAVKIEGNGETLSRGVGGSLGSHPAEILVSAANIVARRNQSLDGGWVALIGPLTPPVTYPLDATITARFSTLGEAQIPRPRR